MTEKISQHFTLKEATTTSKDLPNLPDFNQLKNIFHTALRMEIVREILDQPILVSSWFRSAAVNSAVGGAKRSAHLSGCAVDFTSPSFGTPYQIVQALEKERIDIMYDQLIYEKRGNKEWVHIGFVIPPAVPRLETLTLMPDGSYRDGLIFQGVK